ncbi:MAG: glycosyltransferase family 39 protein [Anaerolineales bacterium]|nr:glycosyltransferase family 39 protein [Anaerolineales bacterium]
MNSTQWTILALILVVFLDAYFIWVWRRYRRLRQAQWELDDKERISLFQCWLTAMRINIVGQIKKWLSKWKNEKFQACRKRWKHDSEKAEEEVEVPQADSPDEEEPPPQTSGWLKILFLGLGAGSVLLSLWLQQGDWDKLWQWKHWALFAAGLIFLFWGQIFRADKELPSWANWIRFTPDWLGVKTWQIVFLLLSVPAVIVATVSAGYEAKMKNKPLAIVAWLASIGFAIIGGWQKTPKKRIAQRTAILLACLLVGAFLVRVVNLTHIPILLTGDEGSVGISAVHFIEGETNNIFKVEWFSFPSFYFYLQSLSISIFGKTAWALRITSVIAGALTVGALYLVAKPMFGERTALFSSVFLATLHFHNHFSRIGLNNIWDGLWFVVVLGLLWYGWEKEHRLSFLLGGFFLGIAQYFYVSSRALLGLVPAWILLVGILDWPKLQRNLSNFLLMGLVAFVTVFPLARFYIKYPNEFLAPFHRVSILGSWLNNQVDLIEKPAWLIILNQIKLSFMGYTHVRLGHWYKPGVPILRWLPATLFYLGLVALLKKPRRTQANLLLFWLIGVGLMGGMSVDPPSAQRYLIVAPVLALTVGLGLSTLATELGKVWQARAKLIRVLAILVIVLVAADELRFYFLEYTPSSNFGGANSMVAQRLADFLQEKPDDYQVFFFGHPRMGYDSIRSLPYLAPHITGYTCTEPWGSDENPSPTSDQLGFVFLPKHQSKLEAVQADYPSGKLLVEKIRDDQVLYYLYEVSLNK